MARLKPVRQRVWHTVWLKPASRLPHVCPASIDVRQRLPRVWLTLADVRQRLPYAASMPV